MNFFGSMNGNFSVSPQDYHNKWRKQVGARKSFLGPWDYKGGGQRIKSKYVSPQEVLRATSSKAGFISPVDELKTTKKKIYTYGANRTQAISEE